MVLHLCYIDGKNFWAQTHIRLGLGPKTTIKLRRKRPEPRGSSRFTRNSEVGNQYTSSMYFRVSGPLGGRAGFSILGTSPFKE